MALASTLFPLTKHGKSPITTLACLALILPITACDRDESPLNDQIRQAQERASEQDPGAAGAQACEDGDPVACMRAIVVYLDDENSPEEHRLGVGVAQDDASAQGYAAQACSLGHQVACDF